MEELLKLIQTLAVSFTNLTTEALILCVTGIPALIIISTWLLTLLKSSAGPRDLKNEPPVAPYWIPYLQHLIPFLVDPNKLLQSLRMRYPNTPFTVMMMNTKFHIFSSPETASAIFGRSRDFIFGPVLASMMENGLNLPLPDRPKYSVPISDKRHSEIFTKGQREAQEFVEANHALHIKYLSGKWLDEILKVYMDNFFPVLCKNLELDPEIKIPEDGGWKTVNLHEMMRKVIFDASALTFFGTRLSELWGPKMWEDWKVFNDATYAGVRSNFSYYLQPRALMARKCMLDVFDQWVGCEVEEWPENEGVWREKWGIRMNWEREELTRKFGFTKRGRSCSQAGFLFVIITNAAPMATWFTLCIVQSPDRLARYRKICREFLLPQEGNHADDLRFDMAKLRADPFVQGLWKEALRLGSASAAARVVTKDVEVEGYTLRKGSVVLMPVRLMHFNADIFPEPERFDPQRWIVDLPVGASKEETAAALLKQKKQNASLRSFGGGVGLCSGRHVAEQEILSTVSTILLLFDIELEKDQQSFELNPRSLGIMSPAREPTLRIRKRSNARSLI